MTVNFINVYLPTHQPVATNPPTHRPLTHRPTNHISSKYIKMEDQILHMFSIIWYSKTFIFIYLPLLLNKQMI